MQRFMLLAHFGCCKSAFEKWLTYRLHLFFVFWLYYIFSIFEKKFKVVVIKRQKKKTNGERKKYFVLANAVLSILTGV